MDLEQMKKTWEALETQIVEASHNKTEIDTILVKKGKSSVSNIIWMEGLGCIISVAAIIYLLFSYPNLHFTGSKIALVVTILCFSIAVYFSVWLLFRANQIRELNQPHSTMILRYQSFQKAMKTLKKTSIVLYIIMPFFIVPLCLDLFKGIDLFAFPKTYSWAVFLCFLILPLVWYLFFKLYAKKMKNIRKMIFNKK